MCRAIKSLYDRHVYSLCLFIVTNNAPSLKYVFSMSYSCIFFYILIIICGGWICDYGKRLPFVINPPYQGNNYD